jgi:hypothetical protein
MIADCPHVKRDADGAPICAYGKFGARPHVGVCLRQCPHGRGGRPLVEQVKATPERKPCNCRGL